MEHLRTCPGRIDQNVSLATFSVTKALVPPNNEWSELRVNTAVSNPSRPLAANRACTLRARWGKSLLVWRNVLWLLFSLSYGSPSSAIDGTETITTIVGEDDGGPLIPTMLSRPKQGITVDSAGNLYIADSNNNRILKRDREGVISTVAGNGTTEEKDDGVLATETGVWLPSDVAVDNDGNLYISTGASYRGFFIGTKSRIRRVDSTGKINTVAGNGDSGFRGDGGPASVAELSLPSGIAVDNFRNLYIADTNNYRIRKVDTSGIITTVAGNGTFAFSGDGGPATAASLVPTDIAVDNSGNLFVADPGNHSIRRVDSAGIITTVAGNGSSGLSGDGGLATQAALSFPQGLAVDDSGNLYIADTWNHRIRKVDPAGIITTVAGNNSGQFSGDGGRALEAALSYPNDVAVDKEGNLYIADSGNDRIRKVDAATARTIPVVPTTPAGTTTTTTDLTLKIIAPKKMRAVKALAYRFVVRNKTKLKIPDVVVTGLLNNAVVYQQEPRFCSVAGQTLSCQLGTFNGKKRKSFTVKVKPSIPGTLRLSATVTGEANDSKPANNTAAVSTTIK